MSEPTQVVRAGLIVCVGDEVAWRFDDHQSDSGCIMLRDQWYPVVKVEPPHTFAILKGGKQHPFVLCDKILVRKKPKIDFLSINRAIVGGA